jgi:maltooligosyltrehalose trehalohydrolase
MHIRDSVVWRPSLGAWPDGDAGIVRVWAPTARTVAVREAPSGTDLPRTHFLSEGLTPGVPLVPERDTPGYFSAQIPWLRAGVRYWLVRDGEQQFSDPASRFQPEGVHGPSELIDPSRFQWRVDDWHGRSIDEAVIYELHVGTFTAEGTFAAAAERLEALAEIGVTFVELMPIAAFPGRWNWGYDPAAQFAPASNYGRPDDLRRLVDRAHALGIGVLLDVVYNHFGPDGAYAAAWSPLFFSDRHASPWGAGINFDGAGGREVRGFFIENALHWLIEYRVDGLRLDATHALIDESAEHFLAELTRSVRSTIRDREVLLIAEDNRNLRTLVERPAANGCGLDAIWADDFHHVARRLTAGDDEGYYRDFVGTADELGRVLRDGWLYRGEHSAHAEAPRGTDPTGLPLSAFVICLQNHDQVGNRAFGERLNREIDPAVYRALTVLLLLAPETPLLFMGQEWAATTPFLYFTDHAGELGRLVREGRRQEFRHFRAFVDEVQRDRIPDPQDPRTFQRSRLHWDERDREPHIGVLTLYRQALALRRTLIPAGRSGSLDRADVDAVDASTIVMRRRQANGAELWIVARLAGSGIVRLPVIGGLRMLDTEAANIAADPQPATVTMTDDHVSVELTRPGALVLV